MRLLVTRPEPGATATAERLRAMGHAVTVAPLLMARARAWTPPDAPPPALAFTSATGVRFAGAARRWADVPVFAVGPATMRAARAAGFTDVRDGGGTVATLFARAAAAGSGRLLHLAGADRTAVAVPAGLRVDVALVYAAGPVPLPADAVGAVDAALLYSPRTAALFAVAIDGHGIDRATIAIAAISAAAADAAGGGWRRVAVAAAPDEDALFAVIDRLCDKRDEA